MKKYFLILLLILTAFSAGAQNYTLKVWPDGAPDSNGLTVPEDNTVEGRVSNISEAEMYVFLPAKESNTGAAVVICPGGGYIREAMNHEGYDMARWLSERGVAGIVLKYRLPYSHYQIPSEDAHRAIRIVRMNAGSWGINPGKIGIAGSSAGGHLASTVGTKFDSGNPSSGDPLEKIGCRPDFMLLLYPVVTMKEEFTHAGSRKNLLGEGNDWNLVQQYSNELHVTTETPPVFLVLADDDKTVPPRNSIEFYTALKVNKVPAEMHIFAKGGHGFGMRKNNIPADKWPELFMDWLKATGFINN
jgi:acetyl esterase/lipase